MAVSKINTEPVLGERREYGKQTENTIERGRVRGREGGREGTRERERETSDYAWEPALRSVVLPARDRTYLYF